MNNSFGHNIRITLYGSSHASCVGARAVGFAAGIRFSEEELAFEMARRAPGRDLTSPRKEGDEVRFLSGVTESDGLYETDGTPICVEIANQNVRLSDYEKMDYYRPSHGDYTYSLKYPGREDNRPSGRMTAPLAALGLIARKALGITVVSHIKQIGCFTDLALPQSPDEGLRERLKKALIPTVSETGAEEIASYIRGLAAEGDSCGAAVETMVEGLPGGFGEPYFRGIDAALGEMLFSVPGLRALLIGDAADFPHVKGSSANDAFICRGGQIRTATNHSGGVNAGIANGMPLVFTVIFRPTPSVSKLQHTVDFDGKERLVSIGGRHDPCFALRAIPAVEACAALALYDLSLEGGKEESLADYRREFDTIDNRIALLLLKRKELAQKIGQYKAERDLPLYQPNRECAETARILDAFFAGTSDEEKQHVADIMTGLYRYSRFVQGENSEND